MMTKHALMRFLDTNLFECIIHDLNEPIDQHEHETELNQKIQLHPILQFSIAATTFGAPFVGDVVDVSAAATVGHANVRTFASLCVADRTNVDVGRIA